MVYKIKANHEIFRKYRCTVLLYFDGIKANHEIIRQYRYRVLLSFDWLMVLKQTMHMIGCDWLMGCDTKCVTH